MKRSRKGFTLVEFLIIIVIIGILSTVMMLSFSTVRGKAKAASIMTNVDTCKVASNIYQAKNNISADEGAANFLSGDIAKKYVPNFKDFSSTTISYDVKDKDWNLYVSFVTDTNSQDIIDALRENSAYSVLGEKTTKFFVNLMTGEVSFDKNDAANK